MRKPIKRAPRPPTKEAVREDVSRRCVERHRRLRRIWQAEGRGRYRDRPEAE